MIEPVKPVISGLKKSQAELGYVDHSQNLKSKNRGFTIRFKDRQQQLPAEAKPSADAEEEQKRKEAINSMDYQIRTQTKQINQQKLQVIIDQLSQLNSYVGNVASTEMNFMKMTQTQRLASTSSMGS